MTLEVNYGSFISLAQCQQRKRYRKIFLFNKLLGIKSNIGQTFAKGFWTGNGGKYCANTHPLRKLWTNTVPD